MSLPFTTKKEQLQFTNCVVSVHDLACNCPNPLYHATHILLKQLAPDLHQEEKNQLKQCLGEDAGTSAAGDIDLDAGDLEKLFEQDITEDDTG